MAKEYGGINTSTGETSLDRPFVEILSRIFEAELSDNPSAINNMCRATQMLATMTLDPESGKAVKNLNHLDAKVHTLINQHYAYEISIMSPKDDDMIEYLRDCCKKAIDRVSMVIGRYIRDICVFSFTNGPMSGCTIRNTGKLSFNTAEEFADAKQAVVNELSTLGLEDVAFALTEGTELETAGGPQQPSRRHQTSSVVQPGERKFGSSKYRGPTESDALVILTEHPGLMGEALLAGKLKQWKESKNVNAG